MNAWPRKERPGDVSRKLSTSETTKRGSGDPEIERGVKLVEHFRRDKDPIYGVSSEKGRLLFREIWSNNPQPKLNFPVQPHTYHSLLHTPYPGRLRVVLLYG